MVKEIGEELRNHGKIRGCGLRNKNPTERDVIISWGLMRGVSTVLRHRKIRNTKRVFGPVPVPK